MHKIILSSVVFLGSSLYSYKLGIQNIPARLHQKWSDCSVALLTDNLATELLGSSSEHYLAKYNICCMALFSAVSAENLTEESLSGIDVLLVDVADFGVCSTPSSQALLRALSVASASNTKIVILDRPNPLGYRIESPLMNCNTGTTVLSIPLRHGMTAGELAWFCNMHCLSRPAHLQVVQISGYDREHDGASSTAIASLFSLANTMYPLSYQNGVLSMPLCGTQADWNIFTESMSSCGITVAAQQSDCDVSFSLMSECPSDLSFFKAIHYIANFLSAQSIACKMPPLYELCQGQKSTFDLIHFFGKARSSFMYAPFPIVSECL